MALRAWTGWGVSAVLVAGLSASAKPPVPEPRPGTDGHATPAISQDHFLPAELPAPRLQPEPVRDAVPVRLTPPTASPMGTPTARAAFEKAEAHFRACDTDKARTCYRQVIALAPGSWFALVAAERLSRTDRVLTQSAEPPLADPPAPKP